MGEGEFPELDEWHVLRGEKRHGPHPFAIIRAAAEKNIITPDDFLWRPGWEDWRLAKTVNGLFAAAVEEGGSAPTPARRYNGS